MTNNQKLIKNLAMGFAIFLAISIVTSIITVVSIFFNSKNSGRADRVDYRYEITEEVTSIRIEHGIGELNIRTGDKFLVETENVRTDFKCNVSNGTLMISENDKESFFTLFNGFKSKGLRIRVTITIPEDFVAESIIIKAGVGNINISNLTTEYLNIDGGTGNINGEEIFANKVNIDNGVGNTRLVSATLNDVTLDGGVGNVNISGIMTGKNSIDAGVGNITISIEGEIDDYNLSINPGVGRVNVNGMKQGAIKNTDSDAEHFIKLNGGVGNINLDID